MPNLKNVIGGTFEDVNTSVVKPVKDEVGQAIETGTQSVVYGPPPQSQNPQNLQPIDNDHNKQKQLEDQKKMAETRRKLDFCSIRKKT